MRKFLSKTYGKIFVEKPKDIKKVRDEIREMDAFEYDYLPDGMISVMPEAGSLQLCYTSKFDALDLDMLTIRLWRKGIKILIISDDSSDFLYIPEDKDPDPPEEVFEERKGGNG